MMLDMKYHYTRLKHKLWWRLVTGIEIKVDWPGDASADPNNHYRPWMEANVGTQCWDWDWDLRDNDLATNKLTIKFRRGKEQWATQAQLKWSDSGSRQKLSELRAKFTNRSNLI